MRKFLLRALISASLVLSFAAVPSFADTDNEAHFEALSPEFLQWQAKHESSLPSSKNALPSDENEGGYIPFPVDLSHLAANPPVEESSPYRNMKADTLPEKYDLRDVGGKSYVTSVKSQLPYGTCWAHASLGAMESNLLMQEKGTYDLSEMHLAWYAFRGDDKSKAFLNMHSSTFDTVMGHGGNSFYPAALLTRLSGPASEADVPYGRGKQPSAGSPDDYTRAARLREIYYLSFTNEPNVNASSSARDIVKRRIMQTGAVVGNYCNYNSNYLKTSSGGTSFYYNSTSVNHAVQIIGWDDNYSRSNFKTNPGMDGAWLIKNSWDDEWWTGSSYVGDEGCFWMSYAQYLTEGSAYIAEEPDSNMNAYYYDALGWCSTLSFSGSTIHAANVFKATRNETLAEVGFITPDNNISYEVSIYTGMSAMPSSSPIPSGTRAGVASASGTIPYAGYHTVTLNDPVALSEGEYFSVVITFTNTGKAPVEKIVSGWSDNAEIEEGSFFSSNGTSWSTGKKNNVNATVKAFTVTGAVKGSAPKIDDSYPPDAFVNQSYTATITASGTSPITWSDNGNLPAGLALDASTGVISGAPTTEGSYTFSVTAANDYGSDTKSFTLNVWDVPAIDDSEEITGYVGYSLSHQMTLTPSASAKWSTSDTLPAGLKLSTTGLISGKPTKAGTYSATLKAVSSSGTSEASVTFTINPKPVMPVITTASTKTITVGEEFSQTIELTGTLPITLTMQGHPNGITLKSATAYMSGTPTTAGTYNVKLTAENIATELSNKTVTKTLKLIVKERAPVISAPSSLPDAVVGEKYSEVSFSLSDGGGSVTWKLTGQPSGMSMNSAGVLSGTPTKAGKFTLTIKATTAGGTDTVRLPLTVLQKPVIANPKMTSGVTDRKYTARLSAKGSTPMTWKIEGLPETLSLTQNALGTTATITGTPVEAGTYGLKLTVSNAAGSSESTVYFYVAGVAPRMYATLARGKDGEPYEETRIYATGTKPITIDCIVSDNDLAKFGLGSLDDLGLTFTADPESGTAVLRGTSGASVKNLPIIFTAENSVSSVKATKKASLTVTGSRPSFASPSESTVNIVCPVNSEISQSFQVQGSKHITYSMSSATGFELDQHGEYDAVLTGTAPARDSTVTITVTAENADGKATKRVVIKAQTPPAIIIPASSETNGGGMIPLPSGTLKKSYSTSLTATGTKTITWTLEGTLPDGMKFSGGKFSGTPKEAGDFTFTVTASNAVGSDTAELSLSIADPNAETGSLPEDAPETLTEALPKDITAPETVTADPEISFGSDRTSSEHQAEIEGEGYVVAAVLPEVSVNVSGMYDIEAELSENVPVGAKLYWLAYPDGEGSEDDAIAEFYDEAGAEIETVPDSRKVVVSVWLNEGVKYSPVIAVK